MPQKKRQSGDDGPPGPGSWIVTFSDCMTLLLCFFVLLLSFSSFDPEQLQRLAGSFDFHGHPALSDENEDPKDSLVDKPEKPFDVTEKGSEIATDVDPKKVDHPLKLPTVLDIDAYKDQRTFFIPSRGMFFGNGSTLTPGAKKRLVTMAQYMELVPCRVVITEVPGRSGYQASAHARALNRSVSVMTFLTRQCQLSEGRFSISGDGADDTATSERFGGRAVLKITLLAREVYE